jgi:alkanesulfonate monooxygenase SsuD/methylene tetrahydromethanopterin reductase-like flavin-dependent oxidoreductase (luciferase family)
VTHPRLEKGAARTGRSEDEVRLLLAPLIATGASDEELCADRERQRELLAFLYSTPAYWPSLELFGWEDRGRRLRELTREGKWAEMTALIDDEMLGEMLPSGTYGEIGDVLRERYAGLSHLVTFPLPQDDTHDAEVARALDRLHA